MTRAEAENKAAYCVLMALYYQARGLEKHGDREWFRVALWRCRNMARFWTHVAVCIEWGAQHWERTFVETRCL